MPGGLGSFLLYNGISGPPLPIACDSVIINSTDKKPSFINANISNAIASFFTGNSIVFTGASDKASISGSNISKGIIPNLSDVSSISGLSPIVSVDSSPFGNAIANGISPSSVVSNYIGSANVITGFTQYATPKSC